MDQVEVDLYARSGNWAVLRLPGRRFPGVFLQGDTFSIACSEAAAAQTAINAGNLKEARDALAELTENLDGLLRMYISALDSAGHASTVHSTIAAW